MKPTQILTAFLATAMLDTAFAHPGMAKVVDEIGTLIKQRQSDGADPSLNSNELIGDLLTLKDSQLTPVAKDIKAVITNSADGQSSATYSNIPQINTAACAADTCCIWHYVANDMVAAFKGPSGRCTNLARGAVRLGFHDAAGFSKATGPQGGADGSIILAAEEMTRVDNRGLEPIVAQTKAWYDKYKSYGVTAADLIQMGANVATVVCPLGPRVKSYVGRKDSSVAAPNGLLPNVNSSASVLIELFQNKTIEPNGLTSLLGAHTTSQQRFVDPARAGDPQDSTPGVWDVLYYNETINPNAPPRVFKFQSDINLAADPRTGTLFKFFADPAHADRQQDWNERYAREYVRLSLLGVMNINNLTDCTKVLPAAVTSFSAPDKCQVQEWSKTDKSSPAVASALLNGQLITNMTIPRPNKVRRNRA